MAANKEQTEEIVQAAKSLCFEHGEVYFIVAVKDEDGYWRYSMNISVKDAMTMLATIATECVASYEANEGA